MYNKFMVWIFVAMMVLAVGCGGNIGPAEESRAAVSVVEENFAGESSLETKIAEEESVIEPGPGTAINEFGPNPLDESSNEEETRSGAGDNNQTEDSGSRIESGTSSEESSLSQNSENESSEESSTPENSGDKSSEESSIPENSGDKSSEESSDSDQVSEEDDVLTDYEIYLSMSGQAQTEFINSFESVAAFFNWLNVAKAEYEALHPDIEIGADGVIDMDKVADNKQE